MQNLLYSKLATDCKTSPHFLEAKTISIAAAISLPRRVFMIQRVTKPLYLSTVCISGHELFRTARFRAVQRCHGPSCHPESP